MARHEVTDWHTVFAVDEQAVAINWVLVHVSHGEHTASDVALPANDCQVSTGQDLKSAQTRSDVAVLGMTWNWPAVHTVVVEQFVSETDVDGTETYCDDVHV